MDPANQDAMLRELADRHEITELIHAYCERFDRNDPDGVAALFTADAVIDYNPDTPNIAGEDLAASMAVGLDTIFAATSHHVSNISITFERDDSEADDADDARSRCYLDAWHRYHDGSPDGFLWGRYLHRFRRTPGGWRISELLLQAAGTVDFHRERMHGIGRG
jgi:ketosteroid isomerase-like protein